VHEEEGFLELLCFVVGPNLVEISEKFHGAPNFPRLLSADGDQNPGILGCHLVMGA